MRWLIIVAAAAAVSGIFSTPSYANLHVEPFRQMEQDRLEREELARRTIEMLKELYGDRIDYKYGKGWCYEDGHDAIINGRPAIMRYRTCFMPDGNSTTESLPYIFLDQFRVPLQ